MALLQPENTPWKKIINKGHGEKKCRGCAIEDLLSEAGMVSAAFGSLFEHFKQKTKCEKKQYKLWGKVKNTDASKGKYQTTQYGRILMEVKDRDVTQLGGLKGAPRIEQKCFTKYYKISKKEKINKARYINDVVRGTITFNNCGDIIEALEYIKKMEGKSIPGTEKIKYKIARAKQIYEPKSPLLYGDIKLNIQITTGNSISHNCELQLNHIEMIKAKGTKDGHGAYEAWRNMDDEHWMANNCQLPAKLKDMPADFRARAKNIVHKSHSAYYKASIVLTNDKNYQDLLGMIQKF